MPGRTVVLIVIKFFGCSLAERTLVENQAISISAVQYLVEPLFVHKQAIHRAVCTSVAAEYLFEVTGRTLVSFEGLIRSAVAIGQLVYPR